MTDYAFTGKKGTGKSKHAVIRMRDQYFKKNRKVSTNLDLFLKPMFGVQSRQTYIRIPDKPTEFDLLAAGHGNPDSYDEEKAGCMVLDELGTWFNARTFNDKSRAGTLDYLAHARKHGWDCYYIMQDVVQVDKQLRESFVEQTCRHIRFDKVRVPFVGQFLSLLFGEKAGYLPRFHGATFRMGTGAQDLVCDRLMFKGLDVESCYDTRQVFLANYPHGTHSVLSPWHVEGRYLAEEKLPWWKQFLKQLFAKPAPIKPKPLRPVDPAYAKVLHLVRQLPEADRAYWLTRWQRMAGVQ